MLPPEAHLETPQQIGGAEPERAGDPDQHEVRRIRSPAFDAPKMVLVNVGAFGKTLLRAALLDS